LRSRCGWDLRDTGGAGSVRTDWSLRCTPPSAGPVVCAAPGSARTRLSKTAAAVVRAGIMDGRSLFIEGRSAPPRTAPSARLPCGSTQRVRPEANPMRPFRQSGPSARNTECPPKGDINPMSIRRKCPQGADFVSAGPMDCAPCMEGFQTAVIIATPASAVTTAATSTSRDDSRKRRR